MPSQSNLFEEGRERHKPAAKLPQGLKYRPNLVTADEEKALLARLRALPFQNFNFHGFEGKRRTISFGWQYEFSGAGKLQRAEDIPEFFLPLRRCAAEFAGVDPASLQHVLAIEYGPGAGIGWHRDKSVFGDVIGVSLLAPCVLRFRRTMQRATSKGPQKQWERFNLRAEPRSAYFLSGPARSVWEHSILRVNSLRYSITFRTMGESKS